MQKHINCSFCSQTFEEKEFHDCVTKIFSLINSASQSSKDPETLFNDIDNLVFEGGGVKGLAYLGVLNQLENENKNVIKNLKRVAGNSAGSLMALYIALNLDYEAIDELMQTDYRLLLNDGVNLKVAYNLIDWFWRDYKYKIFRVSDVVFTAKDVLSEILGAIKKDPEAKAPKNKLQSMLKNIFWYYGSKTSFLKRWGLNISSGTLASIVAKVLIYFMIPAQTHKPKQVLKAKFAAYPADSDDEEEDLALESTIASIAEDAYAEYEVEAEAAESEKVHVLELEKDSQGQEKVTSSYLSKMEEETLGFYTASSQQPAESVTDKSELKGEILDYAIGEFLYFAVISQADSVGVQKNLGFFTGDLVKRDLIEGAIERKFKKIKRDSEYRPRFTFKELAEFKDEEGNPLFKPFFVTAYNPLTSLTEVFSVYHTPNAVATDAVRASMSIPIFFQPVTITENGAPRRVYYTDKDGGLKSEEVYYMDGGVLDNYPLWIFDDLKFYLDEIPQWIPKKKIGIQNHRTLGFRLLHKNSIKIYKKPYYDEHQTQRKRVGTTENDGTLLYVIKNLFGAFFGNDENQFIKHADAQRSVFVDNLGVSAVAFDLSQDDKLKLIDSGRKAVEDYKVRAKTNFIGEGEKYISTFDW